MSRSDLCFFGIGGGFLIVPGLMLGSGMPILNAIGSSLFSVGGFGLTTAISYALSNEEHNSAVGPPPLAQPLNESKCKSAVTR